MSSTIATLLGRGLITETVDRENTYIIPGVNQTTGEVNDQTNQQFHLLLQQPIVRTGGNEDL